MEKLISFVFAFLLLAAGKSKAQTDFPALKQQFLDYREAEKQDSALYIAQKMNQLALEEQTDTGLLYSITLRYIGNCYFSLNAQDSAIFYYRLSLKSLEMQGRKFHVEYINSQVKLSFVFQKQGNYKEAKLVTENSINTCTGKTKDDSIECAELYKFLGILHYESEDYDSAEICYKLFLKMLDKILPEKDPYYIAQWNDIGIFYSNIGKIQLSEYYYKRAIHLINEIYGEKDSSYLDVLSNLSELYLENWDYGNAEITLKKELKVCAKYFGKRSSKYASILHNFGRLFSQKSEFKLAVSFYRKAQRIQKKNIEVNSLDYVRTLESIGSLFDDIGDFNTANFYYTKAQDVYEVASSLKTFNFAHLLNLRGVLNLKNDNYEIASTYLFRSIEMYKENLGYENSRGYANTLHNLGILYMNLDNYILAERYLNEALVIRKKVLGVTHRDYAHSLLSYGNLLGSTGDYNSALRFYSAATEIIDEIHEGGRNLDYVSAFINLGIAWSDLGDFSTAERYYIKALEILKEYKIQNSEDYGIIYHNLGVLYNEIGNYEYAEQFYKKALIIKKGSTKYSSGYARTLNSLGNLYSEIRNKESAIVCYERSLRILKKVHGEYHTDYLSTLNNLAHHYLSFSDNVKAENYLKAAFDRRLPNLDVEHPVFLTLGLNYSVVLLRTMREHHAFHLLSHIFSKKVNQISNNFEGLDKKLLESFWKNEKRFFEQISCLSNSVFEHIPEAVGLNYNSALVFKGRLLEAKISNGIYTKEIDKLRINLLGRRSYLNKLESDITVGKEKIDKVRSEVDSLDRSLILCWPEYSKQKKNLSITWDQVQENLVQEEAAIEFVRFYDSKDSSYYYNALILKKYDKMPTLVRLCKEVDLKPLIKKKFDNEILDKEMLIEYYSLIWQPLEASLDGIKVVYYSPVGKLNEVPFHAIPIPSSKSLQLIIDTVTNTNAILNSILSDREEFPLVLSDRYTLHQLTSTRYLALGLKDKSKELIGSNIVLLGGVNYNYIPGTSNEHKIQKFEMAANRSSTYNPDTLPFLPATKVEVEQVSRQLTEVAWQTKLIEYDIATEESVKKLENKEVNGILHFATHGYAFPKYDFMDTTISKNSLRNSYKYSIDPMERSGLILAGGNWAWTGSDTLIKLGKEDGILTALEVSQLNLKNTKLVVLSACKTGLGNIQGSEGTFGLKRGFKLAGVEQLIVSLWEVPDKATMELMTHFYSDLTKTLNPVISFEKAQKEMRIKYPADPGKWAGFVLVR